MPTPAITGADLKAFHTGGFRGIRFSLSDPSSRAVTPEMAEPLSKRVADLGWHVQFNVDGQMIDEMASMLRRLAEQRRHVEELGCKGWDDNEAIEWLTGGDAGLGRTRVSEAAGDRRELRIPIA